LLFSVYQLLFGFMLLDNATKKISIFQLFSFLGFQFFGSATGAGAKPPWRAKRAIAKIVGGTLGD
jgi:hypothetical protein